MNQKMATHGRLNSLVFFLYLVLINSHTQTFYHLTNWSLSNANRSILFLPANVPGNVHSTLLKEKKIPDPYYRFNELELKWIPQDTWIYSTTFWYSKVNKPSSHSRIYLVFEGIDSIGNVLLNHQSLGTCENMFRSYSFDITSKLQENDSNNITVILYPPLKYAKSKAQSYPYPVPSTVNYNTWTEPTYRSFVRKAASDFGWDWGPAMVTCGLWKPVYIKEIIHSEKVEVENYFVHQNHFGNGSIGLDIELFLQYSNNQKMQQIGGQKMNQEMNHHRNKNSSIFLSSDPHHSFLFRKFIEITIHLDSNVICKEMVHLEEKRVNLSCVINSNTNFTTKELNKKFFKLWYPRGYGEAILYPLGISINGNYHFLGKIGLRKIELINDERLFQLQINDIPIFIKGANWIPMDSIHSLPNQTDNKLNLLQSLVKANMNMIRVWGGGIYEENYFYEFCDKNGILVWQELMFACSMYPRDEAFLENVAIEVSQQVSRLAKYTSIVLWGENNENEAMMEEFAKEESVFYSTFNRDVAVVDYVKLFIDTIRPILLHIDSERPTLDTSPSNGLFSMNPYVKRWGDIKNISLGDIHFYNYTGDCMNRSLYPLGKFISEFGFQSLPSFYTWSKISKEEDWNINSSLYAFRQRHENGNQQIIEQIKRNFHLPFDNSFMNTKKDDFDNFLYLTQLQQALCYDTAVHTWRINKNKSPGFTMGILYWQLNDIWQGPSWSSIEYGGKWKLLHYFARRFYSPFLLGAYLENDRVQIHATSDINTQLSDKIQVELYHTTQSWHSNVTSFFFELNPLDSKTVLSVSMDQLLNHSISPNHCFLRITCNLSPYPIDLFFVKYKNLQLLYPTIQVKKIQKKSTLQETAIEIHLVTDALALFVYLELHDVPGDFSDNGFHMLPEKTMLILFYPQVDMSSMELQEIEDKLQIRCLQHSSPETVLLDKPKIS